MSKIIQKENFLKFITLTFCVSWLVTMLCLNKSPVDAGDGLMHFYISQASWSKPLLFLDNWGKPLFTLLSSGFAQFGFNGFISFNILVFIITTLFAWKILNHFSIALGVQLLFPLLLIHILDYSSTVLAGLTEPLLSMFLMIATWQLVTKRWFWFATIVSFLPFLRNEGQLPLILGLFILLFSKQFKYVPFLFFGFIIYSIIGYFSINDFWWYFTKSSYEKSNNIYGVGSWNHYLKSYLDYLGKPGLLLFIISGLRIVYLLSLKKWKEIEIPWLLFSYGTFFGVLFIHSYFWVTGQYGSLGLTRIATQGMPEFILINLFIAGRIHFLPAAYSILKIAVFVLMILLVKAIVNSPRFPTNIYALNKDVYDAADYLFLEKDKGKTFYFHHPNFTFRMKDNPLVDERQCILFYNDGLAKELGTRVKPGDYIIRDSHFGPQEMRLPLSEISQFPELIKVKEFISSFQEKDKYNETEAVVIYQYLPSKKK